MSRTWTAATPVRWSSPYRADEYLPLAGAKKFLPPDTRDLLESGDPFEVMGGATLQLIPEAVAMADGLPLDNGR